MQYKLFLGALASGKTCNDAKTYRTTVARSGTGNKLFHFPVFAMTYGAGNQFQMDRWFVSPE